MSQVTWFLRQWLGCSPRKLMLSALLPVVVVGCISTINLREVCPEGQFLTYRGQDVGCIYDADTAHDRVDELCPEQHTGYLSDAFGAQVPERLGDGRIGCLVCIHEGHEAANAAIEPGGLYPEGFRPGIACLGYFEFESQWGCASGEELAGPDVSTCCGARTIGEPARPGYTYHWSPAEGLSCTDCAQPRVSIVPDADPNDPTPISRTVVYTLDATCNGMPVSPGQVRYTTRLPSCC